MGPNLFPEPLRGATPRTGTAFQVNSDGDSVQLGSRSDQLIDAEQKELQELKARDAEVRAHEQAHVAAAGALYRGGPNYTYQTGPDGNKYAVGGSVQIDTSEGRTPEETIAKAQQIRAAAMAPAEPSSQDRQIAAQAARMEADARAEMAAEQATGEEDGSAGVAGLAGSASAEDAPSIMDSPVAAQPSTNGAMAFVRNGQATSTGLDVLA
ncbi:MAG: putative metalloprotease CJM1_0395 family protein [Planctomycetota bacterium]